jgi:hypothetical protein
VEGIELGLRKQIDTNLSADASRLPSHVNQKIEERVQAVAKKNAAISQEQFERLSRRLEHFSTGMNQGGFPNQL